MASDLVDGDYLGSYRRFIVDFLDKVNPNDQLPIKTSGHDVSEHELVGEIIHMTLQYLNQPLCPPSLQCYIVQLVIEEIKATCRKQPESCGFRQEEKTYAPLKLMQAIASKVNEICQRYLENSRLALLPPPPSTPMPLANAFAIRNNRRKMEDRHVILHDLNTIFNIKGDSIASYYAVFDGHAGYQAAVFCATHLHQYLAESPHYPTDPERALRDAFTTADDIFVEKSTGQTLSSGTTAVCALILNKKLYVAWAGDSQAALAKRGNVTQLVNSHKPDRNDERERIEQMGGYVMHLDIWRVNGNLAVSRAIGDAQYKPYVTGEPEIRCITLDGDEDFLIIGCDGLWDCVTENEAAALVYSDLYRDPYDYDSASQHLVEFAKNQGSIDNITVIVVYLSSPEKIASRSSNRNNPLIADVELDNMEPDNRFASNANGQYDVNPTFVKQTSTNEVSPDPINDDDSFASYAEKSTNGLHRENGEKNLERENYNAEVDDDDLGPETDVDAVDDSTEIETNLANVSRQLFPEKQDPCEIYRSDEPADDETPPSPQANETNQRALIPEADNVGDSEDSEDEWNYYRIDPNKEKEAAAALIAIGTETRNDDSTLDNEVVGAVGSSPTENSHLLVDEDNDSDSSSDSDSEREIRSKAIIANEIIAEKNFVPIDKPIGDEKADETETEKSKLDEEIESLEIAEKQDSDKLDEEDMDFQLNPNAAEFVPVSPTPIIQTRMDLDAPIAGSPLKQTPTMDDIAIPSRREFENEVRSRPCEIEEKSPCKNGDLFADFDVDGSQSAVPTAIPNLDESEISSTKAEFGDESSFLNPNEFQKTGISNLDVSWTDSCGGMNDSNVDSMTKSYGPGEFMNLGNTVDLNAVHDLPDDDFMPDENDASSTVVADVVADEKKMNLENIQTNFDPFDVDRKSEIMDTSSPLISPSSPIERSPFVDDFVERKTESPASMVIQAEKTVMDMEKSFDDDVDNDDDEDNDLPIVKPIVDDTNVTSKLLEMDLEDRGSQDCGFEKCNEKLLIENVVESKNDEVADFLSSPVPRDDNVALFATESLPIESTNSEVEVDKIAESIDKMLVVNDDDDDKVSSKISTTFEQPILLNPLSLHIETVKNSQDNGSYEDVPDYQIPEVPDSSTDIISPLVELEQFKNNPFETSDFGCETSFADSQETKLNLQNSESHREIVESETNLSKLIPEVSSNIDEFTVATSETTEISSNLKLSESLQEFTGLEEQLKPDVDANPSNGLTMDNLIDVQSDDAKIDAVANEVAKPVETIVETTIPVETTMEVPKSEEIAKSPSSPEPKIIEKNEVAEATAVASVAAVAAAGTVAAAAAVTATAAAAAKPSKPAAKPLASKTTTKSAATTKTTSNKSTPTSPTKPSTATRVSSVTAAKKPASTAASRPTKLETVKTSSVTNKTSIGPTKTTTLAPKTTSGRLSASSPRPKTATSSTTKTTTSITEKKPTTNGDATKTSSSAIGNKIGSTTARTTTKPPLKSTTARLSSATTGTTATTAKTRATSAVAPPTNVAKSSSGKLTTGTVGTTTQRPKTAPSGGATTMAAKSRLLANAKSPITEKHIKETANKQISSSRTSTTTTASRTSRTLVSSSTTTTSRRVSATKTSATTTAAAATQAVPPPIRKPAPITRPGGKTVGVVAGAAATASAAVPPNANGKTHVTKTTVAVAKTKVVVENGVCEASHESKIVTSTTGNDDEDVPKKDLSPVEPPADNQLIVAAD